MPVLYIEKPINMPELSEGEEAKGGGSSQTFDLLFYMIIDLKRSIDLR